MSRFSGVVALALLVVGATAGYAALVLAAASWPEVAALRDFYDWQPRAFTEAELGTLRAGLGALAGGALALAASWLATARGRAAWAGKC